MFIYQFKCSDMGTSSAVWDDQPNQIHVAMDIERLHPSVKGMTTIQAPAYLSEQIKPLSAHS